jgi:superfamily II DNA/RNA helicase
VCLLYYPEPTKLSGLEVDEEIEKIEVFEVNICPTYDQNELKNGCKVRNLNKIECGTQRVAEGIGDHFKININIINIYGKSKIESEIDKWEPHQPVFISAQTGQGKNYFIENVLLPYVRELNIKNKTGKKVLIISNRIALKRQIENRIKGNDDQNDEEGKIYNYGEYADVLMYQGILKNMHLLENRYIYVICDEAHFFTSDAMFNPYTDKILSAIVDIFKKAIRVYMTATPYECLEFIKEYEYKKYWDKNRDKYCTPIFYHFKRDYSYLDIMCYSEIDELFGRIVKSVNNNKEKWLIFIDDKEKCRTVKEKLEEYWKKVEEKNGKDITMITEDKNKISMKEKIFAVDANSKQDEAYREMVLKEKLNEHTYVLISTSVLDNGINLNGIHNIVISDISKVKSLQMVGRARVKDANDKKTLYIKRFDEKYVERHKDYFEEQRDAYHTYGTAGVGYYFLMKYYNGRSYDWENAKHWFRRDTEEPNKLYPNEIARSLAETSVLKYQSILEEMRRTDEGQKYTGQKYLEYQMSWFGKTYDEKNDITITGDNKAKEEFFGFLESYVGKKLLKENDNGEDEQKEFSKEFTRLCDEAFGRQDKNKDRVYSLDKMNTILKGYNVSNEVKSDRSTTGDKKTFWEVIRLGSEQEEIGI